MKYVKNVRLVHNRITRKNTTAFVIFKEWTLQLNICENLFAADMGLMDAYFQKYRRLSV